MKILKSSDKKDLEECENFRYWNQFIIRHTTVLDLVRADREGNWPLHLDAMQRALYEFSAWDAVNYQRWGSIYLEEARNLEESHPDIYANFMNGSFSIKDTTHQFVAVGGDQKLEQSINLSSKCSDSIIGHSKQKQFFTEWNLIYHEMMAVKNFFREYADVHATNSDSYQHHQSSHAFTRKHEANVQSMVKFIDEKGSPVTTTSDTELQNFITKEVASDEVRSDLLNATAKGTAKYISFRKGRLLHKETRLSEAINRTNLKGFKHMRTVPKKTTSAVIKEHNVKERYINIARERGFTNDDILTHDVAASSVLFDDSGLMTKPHKSQLVTELESYLSKADDYTYTKENISAFVVDVMNAVRKLPSSVSTFTDFLKPFLETSSKHKAQGRCDYVFDIYNDEPSIKDSEAQRRMTKTPIHLSTIQNSTPFPKDVDSFWPSSQNKRKLQQLIYKELKNQQPKYPIVLGEVETASADWECVQIINNEVTSLPQLMSTNKEADLRIPAHVLDCLNSGYKSVLVVSNDTDVIVLLLYFMTIFNEYNLSELWFRAGVGDTTRFVPLHTLYQKLGSKLCEVLPALHSLTGCDVTSKVGTKKAALKASPETYLPGFGVTSTLQNHSIQNAESFLVKVLKYNSAASNFTDLRKDIFYSNTSKSTSLQSLPPTSQGLLPHIRRAFYSTYLAIHSLDKYLERPQLSSPMAEDFGYELQDCEYIPVTSWKLLDEKWTAVCNCSKCARITCVCRDHRVKCTQFCKCSSQQCQNPIN